MKHHQAMVEEFGSTRSSDASAQVNNRMGRGGSLSEEGEGSRMIKQKIGKYQSFILEREDMVVMMGEVAKHREFLEGLGFEEHAKTREWEESLYQKQVTDWQLKRYFEII